MANCCVELCMINCVRGDEEVGPRRGDEPVQTLPRRPRAWFSADACRVDVPDLGDRHDHQLGPARHLAHIGLLQAPSIVAHDAEPDPDRDVAPRGHAVQELHEDVGHVRELGPQPFPVETRSRSRPC